eukprot:augustus_masked-scaffold_6-processed-gene-12.45-mRNA-1 protein AED:1.00 eAED:1.00 QI:0/-1/0/0/-1/1/1/0/568
MSFSATPKMQNATVDKNIRNGEKKTNEFVDKLQKRSVNEKFMIFLEMVRNKKNINRAQNAAVEMDRLSMAGLELIDEDLQKVGTMLNACLFSLSELLDCKQNLNVPSLDRLLKRLHQYQRQTEIVANYSLLVIHLFLLSKYFYIQEGDTTLNIVPHLKILFSRLEEVSHLSLTQQHIVYISLQRITSKRVLRAKSLLPRLQKLICILHNRFPPPVGKAFLKLLPRTLRTEEKITVMFRFLLSRTLKDKALDEAVPEYLAHLNFGENPNDIYFELLLYTLMSLNEMTLDFTYRFPVKVILEALAYEEIYSDTVFQILESIIQLVHSGETDETLVSCSQYFIPYMKHLSAANNPTISGSNLAFLNAYFTINIPPSSEIIQLEEKVLVSLVENTSRRCPEKVTALLDAAAQTRLEFLSNETIYVLFTGVQKLFTSEFEYKAWIKKLEKGLPPSAIEQIIGALDKIEVPVNSSSSSDALLPVVSIERNRTEAATKDIIAGKKHARDELMEEAVLESRQEDSLQNNSEVVAKKNKLPTDLFKTNVVTTEKALSEAMDEFVESSSDESIPDIVL